jgi:probable DNA metabolism protein
MTDFVYDGSFDGFLAAAGRALAERDARVVPLGAEAADLFAGTVNVATDDDAAGLLRRRIGSAAGADELDTLLLVHSSADPDRHRLLLSYIRLTLRAGRSIAAEIGRPDVRAVRKIRDRVSLEMSHFLGFVRLRQAGGRLSYAPLAPDADIVGLIGPHFAERFPDQAVILHDTRRGIAFWADGAARGLHDMRGLPAGLAQRLETDCDPVIEAAWRSYVRCIANPERRNPRLQRKLMPVRYWGTLVEQPAGTAG